jgi:hypothetical protein
LHCTNSLRKTTLTILDTRRLRLHSTFLDNGVSITSSSRQHASSRLLLYLRASIFHGNIGEGIHDLRQHFWIFHFSAHLRMEFGLTLTVVPHNSVERHNGGEILRQTTKKVSISFAIYLPHEARHESGESVTVWVFLNYLGYFRYSERCYTFSWIKRTCLVLSFTNLLGPSARAGGPAVVLYFCVLE